MFSRPARYPAGTMAHTHYTVYGLYTQYTCALPGCIWFIHPIHQRRARVYMVDIVPHGRWLPGGHVLLRQSCWWRGRGKLSISKLVMTYSKEKNMKSLKYKYKHKQILLGHVLLRQSCCWQGKVKLSISKLVEVYSKCKNSNKNFGNICSCANPAGGRGNVCIAKLTRWYEY